MGTRLYLGHVTNVSLLGSPPCQSFGPRTVGLLYATVLTILRLLTVIRDSQARFRACGQFPTMGVLYQLSYLGFCSLLMVHKCKNKRILIHFGNIGNQIAKFVS